MFVSHKGCIFPCRLSNARFALIFFILVCYFCADTGLRALPLLLCLSCYLREISAVGIGA